VRPIHPLLVHFPLALLPVSAAAEAVGFFAAMPSLSDTGWWTIAAAAVAGVATAAAGWRDMLRAPLSEAVHARVHRHRAIGLVLATAIVALAAWRGWLYFGGRPVSMWYLDLIALTVALAMFQGWLGGELVYRDGVFVQVDKDAGVGTDATDVAAGHGSHPHDH
jgi:uncharacterized membrane protein